MHQLCYHSHQGLYPLIDYQGSHLSLQESLKEQIDEYDENLYEILEDYVTDTVGSYTALQEFIHDRHANDWIEN